MKFFANFVRWALVAICVLFVEEASATDLTIKVFVLPETKACKPDGYAREEYRSRCSRWTADEAEAMFARAVIKSETKVPPNTVIELGGLAASIRNYVSHTCPISSPCADPGRRQSIMLIFEWSEPQSGRVTFTRNAVGKVGARKVATILRGERRWVDHQRADLFLPALGTNWILERNGQWVFSAR